MGKPKRRWLTLLAAGAGAAAYFVRQRRQKPSAAELQDKIVLITGASTGIGRASAQSRRCRVPETGL